MIADAVNKINLAEVVGGGYKTFWNFKGRYCVVKGSRGSKKSKTTALWHIYMIMKHPEANALVVRKTERTLKDSAWADLLWATNRLGVAHLWKANVNPLELTYIPTGQKILFRGFDDSLKLTSITVPKGVLCFCWVEEAYEILNEADFDTLDESVRGQVPEGLFKRFTITFNPWSDRHWLKRRFFDPPNTKNKLAMTTTYKCNEWLDEGDRELLENLKITNPKRYKTAALGEWGIVDGLVYENWEEREFDWREIAKRPGFNSAFGLDFGYVSDPSALFCGLVNTEIKEIYVFDEMYGKAMSNEMIFEEIQRMGYAKERVVADSAEPKSIDRLYTLGMRNIRKARKGRDSINNGIDYIQDFKIYVHPKCVNFLTEISNYTWSSDKTGKMLNKPNDDFNHCLVAGTMIETKYGFKPIEEITKKDHVLTREGYKRVKWAGVSSRDRTVYKVETGSGHSILATRNHGVYTVNDGFKEVRNLKKHDFLLIHDGDRFRMTNFIGLTKQEGRVDKVYDLTVKECPEFFANGILVHNCMDAMRYALEPFNRGSLISFD